MDFIFRCSLRKEFRWTPPKWTLQLATKATSMWSRLWWHLPWKTFQHLQRTVKLQPFPNWLQHWARQIWWTLWKVCVWIPEQTVSTALGNMTVATSYRTISVELKGCHEKVNSAGTTMEIVFQTVTLIQNPHTSSVRRDHCHQTGRVVSQDTHPMGPFLNKKFSGCLFSGEGPFTVFAPSDSATNITLLDSTDVSSLKSKDFYILFWHWKIPPLEPEKISSGVVPCFGQSQILPQLRTFIASVIGSGGLPGKTSSLAQQLLSMLQGQNAPIPRLKFLFFSLQEKGTQCFVGQCRRFRSWDERISILRDQREKQQCFLDQGILTVHLLVSEVLQYHVLPGTYFRAGLKNMKVKTREGSELAIILDSGKSPLFHKSISFSRWRFPFCFNVWQIQTFSLIRQGFHFWPHCVIFHFR